MNSKFFDQTIIRTIFLLLVSISSFQIYGQLLKTTTDKRIDSLIIQLDDYCQNDPHKAIEITTEIIDYGIENNVQHITTEGYFYRGVSYTNLSQFDSAHLNLEKALEQYNIDNNQKGLTLTNKWMGSLFRVIGNSDKALEYYLEAMSIAERNNFNEEYAKLNNNIGGIYLDEKQYDKALDLFYKCLELSVDKSVKATSLSNIGFAYQKKGEYSRAIDFLKKSLSIHLEINNESGQLKVLTYIISTFKLMGQFDLALEYSYHLVKKYESLNLKNNLMAELNMRGLIHRNLKNYDSAIFYTNKALELAKEINYPYPHYIYANLSMIHEDAGQYKEALDHLYIFQEMKDSIDQVQNKIKTDELLAKFDATAKEKEIQILEKEKKLQLAEINQKEMTQTVSFVGAGVMLIVFTIILINYQQKIKAQKLLAIKSEELNKQKELELTRENELKTIKADINGQEKERERIARELHDGIAGNLAGIKLNLENVLASDNGKQRLEKLIYDIDQTYSEVRTLSHHLVPPRIKEISFISLIEKYLDDISKIHTIAISFSNHPQSEINKLSDNIKNEFYRIIQELTINIIKHADAKSIDISLTKHDYSLNLIIEDDGSGFDTTAIPMGIGLSNIQSRVKLLKGRINIDSNINRGTIIDITIPL
ncbi:tetratricopeptide repeat-containing sensor histidine kinase [Marinigracilibium pacificum]|uniref:histidine kinase n=1 Tax=Marinigracilibium pacificum TaxID=2729599 RepID=A0A848J6I0_9BACT|nr:tetratricopeptide repeat protein [Marinigracilibium pacificum]NMM48732.1 tetratricopeptide repeat protein [Marinigracilibium pacificum]